METTDRAVIDAARALADHSVLLIGLIVTAFAAALWLLARRVAPGPDRSARKDRSANPAMLHLSLGLVATAAIVAFVALAANATAGSRVTAFDQAFTDAILDRTSPRGREAFNAITWLGSASTLGVAAAVAGVILVIRRHYVAAAWWLVAQLGAGALVLTLKALIQRPRPEFAYVNELAAGWSFPSGHALRTFVFCAFGAYVVFRYSGSRPAAAIVAVVALTLGVLMAFSRVYLGEHFLADVVAGMFAGTAWVALCISGMEIGERRSESHGSSGVIAR